MKRGIKFGQLAEENEERRRMTIMSVNLLFVSNKSVWVVQ